jgi:hypothetical protein
LLLLFSFVLLLMVLPPAPMAQMLPLADSFSFLRSKLPMLNVPPNLSGLRLGFLPTALVISYKTSIVRVLEDCS